MLVKIIALALTAALVTVILRKHCRELVPFFEIAVLIAALFMLADLQTQGESSIGRLFSLYSEGSEVFQAIFKAATVTVLSRLASDMCRESGNGLMGDIVELAGRMMLVMLAVPFIERVTEIALSFI